MTTPIPHRYSRHPDLRITALAGEGVVLHLGTRRYYTVSESGLLILEALAKPSTEAELVAAVLDRYAVDATQATRSVLAFLERCRETGFLVEHKGP